MPISAYSAVRDNNAAIAPGDIRTDDSKQQQIINSIRQLMADLAGFSASGSFVNLSVTNTLTTLNETLTGLLDLQGGQIKFPAAQVPSADPNTLDDYERGVFTPVIFGSTLVGVGTYTIQQGNYIKIGDSVFYVFNLAWSAHTGTGNMGIGGLPFTAMAGPDSPLAVWFQNLTYTTTFLARVSAAGTTIALNGNASGAGATAVAMDTAASIYGSGLYFV